jgi:pimeloyl-ACP methyl ester carboxylesterase
VAETLYASCGDLSLAYQVFGDGPVELVFVAPTIGSHVELGWTVPEFKAFFEQLATFCRVVLFDQAGFGLSDPVPKVRTLERWGIAQPRSVKWCRLASLDFYLSIELLSVVG